VSVPKLWERAEAELPIGWAVLAAVTDSGLYRHRDFFLADLPREGGRTRQPCAEPGSTHDHDGYLDAGDSRLDGRARSSFSGDENVRMN
jgi:hypothetical protein